MNQIKEKTELAKLKDIHFPNLKFSSQTLKEAGRIFKKYGELKQLSL